MASPAYSEDNLKLFILGLNVHSFNYSLTYSSLCFSNYSLEFLAASVYSSIYFYNLSGIYI